MFSKLALLALATPLASALTLHMPQNMESQGEITITWDTAPGDPSTFTLELLNEEFNDAFAIANNVPTDEGSITVTIPVVPARGGYTLEAVNIGNINEVYSATGQFTVGELTSTSTRSTSGSSTGTGSSSTTRTGTSTGTTTPSTTSHSTSTAPTTSQTTATGANPAATNLNAASSSKLNVVAALAGVAGAAVLAL